MHQYYDNLACLSRTDLEVLIQSSRLLFSIIKAMTFRLNNVSDHKSYLISEMRCPRSHINPAFGIDVIDHVNS